ncbi:MULTISPECIES: DMT family transporter [Mesorhizobium]|uniref:DMT family transporter n=1 Tax=Mesorhizobium denitrificans TaxID=2294114 RepID=A0A371XF12_9HYPH|nr:MULTISPECIES: DMT family transporter [Mesorhizobium]RFC67825.1 DMT family transporter [Mesorhizobium denitrificans]
MHQRAYIYLLLTTLFWGGNAIAGKLAVGHISPMILTAGRWTLAFVIMLVIGWKSLKADLPALRKHWLLLSMLGTFGFTIFNVALYTALTLTTAINVSIEQAGMPMLIFMLNFLFFRLKASGGQIIGLCLTLLGVALTASHGALSRLLSLDLNLGDAIMLASIFVYSGYTVALRFKPDIHWHSLMIVLTGSASLTSLPFVAIEFAVGKAIIPDAQGWAILLYVLIFPSLLAQALYIRGVELIGANRAGLFINLVPIFGTILSIVLLGEEFSLYHAIALALVFGGIALAEYSGRRREAAP